MLTQRATVEATFTVNETGVWYTDQSLSAHILGIITTKLTGQYQW